LRPYDVTPPTTFELPMKFGPPESPKHVPPVAWLLDSRSEWIRWLLTNEIEVLAKCCDHADVKGLVCHLFLIGDADRNAQECLNATVVTSLRSISVLKPVADPHRRSNES
jgi:hypothetical protein